MSSWCCSARRDAGRAPFSRLVAGLEDLNDRVRSTIDDRLVNFTDPTDRNVAMVFQNYALYPHMTVAKNVGFPLETAEACRSGRSRQRVERAAQVARDRRRCSIACQSSSPEDSGNGSPSPGPSSASRHVFLMDEPLSNLDAQLRLQTRDRAASALHERLGITTIYVTHDQVEAMTMGHRIAVMRRAASSRSVRPSTSTGHPPRRSSPRSWAPRR